MKSYLLFGVCCFIIAVFGVFSQSYDGLVRNSPSVYITHYLMWGLAIMGANYIYKIFLSYTFIEYSKDKLESTGMALFGKFSSLENVYWNLRFDLPVCIILFVLSFGGPLVKYWSAETFELFGTCFVLINIIVFWYITFYPKACDRQIQECVSPTGKLGWINFKRCFISITAATLIQLIGFYASIECFNTQMENYIIYANLIIQAANQISMIIRMTSNQILCQKANKELGNLRDEVDTMKNTIERLEEEIRSLQKELEEYKK